LRAANSGKFDLVPRRKSEYRLFFRRRGRNLFDHRSNKNACPCSLILLTTNNLLHCWSNCL